MARSRVFQSKQTQSAPINPFAHDRAILRNARSRYRSLRYSVRKLGIRIKIQEGAAPWFALKSLLDPPFSRTAFKSEFMFRLNSWMRATYERWYDYARQNESRDRWITTYTYAMRTKRRREFNDEGSTGKNTQAHTWVLTFRFPRDLQSDNSACLRWRCFSIGIGSMSTERKRNSYGDKKNTGHKKRAKKGEKRKKFGRDRFSPAETDDIWYSRELLRNLFLVGGEKKKKKGRERKSQLLIKVKSETAFIKRLKFYRLTLLFSYLCIQRFNVFMLQYLSIRKGSIYFTTNLS